MGIKGKYVNDENDLEIVIRKDGYDSERGRPLFLPKAKRHVDCESGFIDSSHGQVVLRAYDVFYSPNGMTRADLTFHQIWPGYYDVHKTERVRKSCVKQLEWRAVRSAAKHNVQFKQEHGQVTLSYDDIVLRRVPNAGQP